MIAFACPSCGKAVAVKDEAGGQDARCPQCKKVIVVPLPSSEPTQATTPSIKLPAAALEATASLGPNVPAAAEGTPGANVGFLAPPQGPGELGRLGSYRVLKVLGAGGMGLVFQAEDLLLKRSVALKVMRPEIAATDINRLRFLREAQAIAAVEHPYIVPIHHVGEERGVPFLAMPMLKGEPLDVRLKREGKLPVAEAVRIGGQVAEGLAAAHDYGLIHRDIKPGNIWLEEKTGFVKILDFGLARASGDLHLTQTGAVIGTPAYMAPEQARGGTVDARCDLFSLGAVMYQMLTAEMPFKGQDTMSVLMALAVNEPAPVNALNPEVPPALSDLVMRLLEKKPGDRPQSAQEVARALAGNVEQGGTVVLNARGSAGGEQRPSSVKRRKVLLMAAVCCLFIGVLVAVLANRGPSSSESGAGNPPPLAEAPFDAAQARAHQEAWAKHLGVPVEYTNKLGMKFRLIPPGKFLMGLPAADLNAYAPFGTAQDRADHATPVHVVRLSRPYYIGESEVPYGLFVELLKREPGNAKEPSTLQEGFSQLRSNCTWFDCIEFCNRLSERESLTPAYRVEGQTVSAVPGATGYRLPTEAEWEFACRAGTTTLWYFGMSAAEARDAIARDGLPKAGGYLNTRSAEGNPFGLFALYGSSNEWCWDWHDVNYYHQCASAGVTVDPQGPATGTRRILRGGSYFDGGGGSLADINSAFRHSYDPSSPLLFNGFGRLVLPVVPRE